MVQIVKQQEQSVLGRIVALYEIFKQNNDEQTAERALQLAKKLTKKEFSIAFCGHFSAGKSTMINNLVGENLLPSSPIPTSANLVKVMAGDEYARVNFKKEKPRVYLAPYDYEKVKTYCKDGDEIDSVEISYKDANLPENVVIMDTPGIDSTDDAHRIATESALHLADLVLYVMDYNHVQSEVNFLFAKELTQAGKELWLVINQIDKHRNEELSFGEFTKSVQNSFASWGVRPEHIFYTSLKDINQVNNQLSDLQSLLLLKMESREEALPKTIYQSLTKLAKDHLHYLKVKDEEEINELNLMLSEISDEQRKKVKTNLDIIQEELGHLKQKVSRAEKDFDAEFTKIINNGYIMPFQTRELAELYLQSCQPEFKVGLFFSKNKTEQARKERLEKFYEDLAEKVKLQLDWHLREFMLKTFKENAIHHPDIMEKAQAFTIQITESLLEQTVKQGARLSGDYVLTYTNDVANAIKVLARKGMADCKEIFLHQLTKLNQERTKQLEQEFNQLSNYYTALRKRNEIEQQHNYAANTIEMALSGRIELAPFLHQLPFMLESKEEVEVIKASLPNKASNDKKTEITTLDEQDTSKNNISVSKKQVENLVSRLRYTAEKIDFVPSLNKISIELEKRADRLERKEFTVALFGAFSAGKSSFANALIGKNILPVSPNPTTAAINRIKPVSRDHQHGTVIVKFKSIDVLLEEVKRSLKAFHASVSTFSEAIKLIGELFGNEENFDTNKKTHYAFLRAFYYGFSKFEAQLGQTILTDLIEFKDFVAVEEKSCLVEWIDVYYDCLLTREGITLVDTPGADSINARHTNVAFEYIKNSDAILFVTYYNHAFSKADREFLIQLGRVKDSFELDKMFFIINAIDLANSEEEMTTVLDYVKDQLITYGIRNPNMFAVSSLLALKEKIVDSSKNESRIRFFEEAFYLFITGELMSIVIAAANNELSRASQLVTHLIASAQENQTSKVQRRIQTVKEQKEIHQFMDEQTTDYLKTRVTQEADELLYYIKQRVFFRLNDFFKEAFSPAVLKADGRNMKSALQMALQELLDSFGFDFIQELMATTLRVETFIGKIIKERFEGLTDELQQKQNGLSFSTFEPAKKAGMTFAHPFQTIEDKMFHKALSFYKNPKSFFEKNEKRFMLEELERVLQKPVDDYLNIEGKRVKDHYIQALNKETREMFNHVIEQMNEYYQGILSTLSDDFPIDELIEVEKQIRRFEVV